ncbi:hypothetical protein N0V95_005314 [Ascochyta clinopodiicola]|nr:hypothetical protein N0V95_005314 [Ascochyta clinopodiicola]
MKDRFRAKPDKKYRPKNWQAMNERADDQIAPTAAVHSVDALQRWALATANITQHGHRPNEAHVVERIRSRYGHSDASGASTQHTFNEREKHSDPEDLDNGTKTATAKRKHTMSPTGALRHGELYVNEKDKVGVRQAKRPRKEESKSNMVATSRMDDDGNDHNEDNDTYAQSSDWSFPSGDEVKTAKTRTHIEIN